MVQERNIVVVLHTKNPDKRRVRRRFLRIDNAIPRMTQLAMQEGRVGDVVEMFHAVSGKQLGTVKLSANGHLKTWWVWED
jgi:hypothetical protein